MSAAPPTAESTPQPGKKHGLSFIHSSLDDYGLSPAGFRVYCHISRRAGSKGTAFASVTKMARTCCLNPQTVRKSLRTLLAHRLVKAQIRHGETTVYRLTPPSTWWPPRRIDDIPSETNTPPSDSPDTAAKSTQDYPSETNGDKGIPNEGNPKKGIEVPPMSPKGDGVIPQSLIASQAEDLYLAYPKQAGKPAAIRAIRRALARHAFNFLLERTRLYASTYQGDPRFIPNPANWFRDERFNDDPSTWRSFAKITGKSRPTIVRPDQFNSGVSKL